jgi:hypothetical protein
MKTRSFALAIALMLMTFTINSALMAQSKDLKYPDNKGKTTVHKIETKVGDVKQTAGTTTLEKKDMTKRGEKIAKNESKNNTGKEMNKMKNKVKHHKMVTNKTEKKTKEKIIN